MSCPVCESDDTLKVEVAGNMSDIIHSIPISKALSQVLEFVVCANCENSYTRITNG